MKNKLIELQHDLTNLKKRLLKQIDKHATIRFIQTDNAIAINVNYNDTQDTRVIESALTLDSFNYALYSSKLAVVKQLPEYIHQHEALQQQTANAVKGA